MSDSYLQGLIDKVMNHFKTTALACCVDNYPVCPHTMAPVSVKDYFRDNPEQPFSNDGQCIYYHGPNFRRLMTERDQRGDVIKMDKELHDYLQREYAHLFLQHTRLRRYYNKDEIKANTFAVACEIESMRLQGYSRDTECWDNSANDDKFACTKPAKYLRQIYQALIEEYGDQIEEIGNEGQSQNDNSDGEQQEDSKGQKQQGDKGKDGENQNQDGDSNQDGKSEDGDDQKSSGDSKKDGQDGQDKQNGSGGGGTPDTGKDRGRSELTDKQKEQIRKTLGRQQQKISPIDGDDTLMQSTGYSPTGEDEEKGIQQLIDTTYQRWRDQQVKKQLRKLKSAIQGKVSRAKHATYARPSRRACMENGLITKGRKKDLVGQPTILVALDASGSMDVQDVQDITTTIGNIFEDLGRPKKGCWICMFDTNIHELHPMRDWEKVVQGYYSGGGTAYDVVLSLANHLDVNVVIEVGDGECYLYNDYHNNKAIFEFMEKGRHWYDVIVEHDEDSVKMMYNSYILEDKERLNYERQPIYIDKDVAAAMKTYDPEHDNY